jgi:hypothetical protein
MARQGIFDPTAAPVGWLDVTAEGTGWFDEDDFPEPPFVSSDNQAWTPVYPDRVPGRAPLATAILTSFFFAPTFDPATSPRLQASEPVRSRPRVQEAGAAYVPALNRWGLDGGQITWSPDFPDFPGRGLNTGPVANRTCIAYVPAVARWGIDGGQSPWRPAYPDFPGRGALQGCIANRVSIAYTPVLSRWGLDSGQTPWRPAFPDALQRRRTPDGSSVTKIQPPAAAPSVPLLAWAPSFPSQLERRVITPRLVLVEPVTIAKTGVPDYATTSSESGTHYASSSSSAPGYSVTSKEVT